MKYLILVPDGMADRPLAELDGKTPLMSAKTPNMDKLAARSRVGLAMTIHPKFKPGSDVANLAIMGYDPVKYYTGRGPLEAASMGVVLSDEEAAWRCNLVTINDGVMADFTASHITSGEAKELIAAVQDELGSDTACFYPGVSYRHLCVLPAASGTVSTPPHDIVGQVTAGYLPKGEGAETLKNLMERSRPILSSHPVNQKRVEQGENPANSIWLWGGGKAIFMPTLQDRYGLSGAVISAVDLIKGIGKKAGMEVIDVPGATGYLDTDYAAKAEYGLKALKYHDILYLHVEAPDEAGHMGDIAAKIEAIENFDALTLGTIIKEAVNSWPDFKIVCLPDHATPIEIRTHSSEPVPYFLYQHSRAEKGVAEFSEAAARGGEVVNGWDLLDIMIKDI